MITKFLGDKPFWRVTLRLGFPIAVQNMLTSSFAIVDTLMVSRLGSVALSSVGMAGQWSWFMSIISFGICSGMSVFASQYWGIGNHKAMRRVLGISLLCIAVLSAVFFFPAFLAPERVISIFNSDAEVIASGSRYMKIACFSYPAVVLTVILSGFLRNIEKVRIPMYVSMVTTVLNAVFNYGLIFGKFGLPEMGVAGAAAATCISSWSGPVLLLAISAFQKNQLVRSPKDLVSFRPRHLLEFARRALPVVFNESLWSLGIVVLNVIYSNMGYEYYAAVTMVKTFSDLSFAFFVGLCNACIIMVGKSVGSGKIKRAVEDADRFSVVVPLIAVFVGALMVIFRSQLVSIFNLGNNISELAISTALLITLFIGCELPVKMISYVQVVGIFRSGGDTFAAMLCDVGSLWLLAIPSAILAAKVFSLPFIAVFIIAYLAEDIPKSIFCIIRHRSLKWLKPVTEEGLRGKEEYFG
ncbi:MAG: MATE family efflux transporter [Oscillospiraceae bacterium]|nr:MATE family efflux transporter [Oscillospiraceae bacterium]MDD7292133.1 MATE family efflux transporter [Clostridiaceae bacterium]MDY5990456.1 MATE family efflux transporter [Oscillospiraceae bacterium]